VFARGEAPRHPPTPEEEALLQAVDGERTLGELATFAGLGQLQALEAAAGLAKEGVLVPAPPPAPPPAEPEPFPGERQTIRLTGPFEIYRRILARVHEALTQGHENASARLNSYFDRLPPRNRAVFDLVRFGPEGDIEVARVLENDKTSGLYTGAAARARALEALEDLLAFALFELKNCLGRAEADAVLKEVGRMQMGQL
jgi:hypothetical protein